MPTTISSLFVFVALLTPGFVYLTRTETRLPGRRYSPLRETATVLSASLITNSIVLAVFAVFRSIRPGDTPDVGAIIREPRTYLQNHYVEVTLWSLALLAAAAGLAAVLAVPPAWSHKLASRIKVWPSPIAEEFITNRRSRAPIRPESGWVTAFHEHEDRMVYVGLRLKDGTYLDGPLRFFSSQIEESGRRDIQLGRPVRIRTPSADKHELESWDVDAVIVSAAEIKTISVHYLPVEILENDASSGGHPSR